MAPDKHELVPALLLGATLLTRLASGQAADTSRLRAMTVDDVLEYEVFGVAAPSPTGDAVALVTEPSFSIHDNVAASRLWLVSLASTPEPEALAVGEDALRGRRVEELAWSPGGGRLAIVARSFERGTAELLVWSRDSGAIDMISSGPMGYHLSIGAQSSPVRWVDGNALVFIEADDDPLATLDGQPEGFFRQIAPRMWKRLAEGAEPTASVMDSGLPVAAGESIGIRVVRADVAAGRREILAEVQLPARCRQLDLELAPDLSAALVRASDKPPPAAGSALSIAPSWREQIGVLTFPATEGIRWFGRDLKPGTSLTWSADSSSAVAFGTTAEHGEPACWTVDAHTPIVTVEPCVAGTHGPPASEPVAARPVSIQLPAGAESVTEHPAAGLTLYTTASRDGIVAHAVAWDSGRTTRLMVLDRWVSELTVGRRMLIEYRGNDGEVLQGIVLLPPGYRADRLYPCLVWVYAGISYGDVSGDSYVLSDLPDSPLNLQLLAARDYVILYPSLPMPREGVLDQALLITPPVLAAVDQLIAAGIADPERLAVAGHSNGGYTTNVIVTQTNRFKAAITMAGASNLTSLYGTFDPRFRYTDVAVRDGTAQMMWCEASQARLGAPLTGNLWAYLRNSPLFLADRIRTPMLFLHGDQDLVPISEAEQLFSSLYRQGKRARLVRYWGEGHNIGASPANTRSVWNEIFAWLDEHCNVTRDANGSAVFDGNRVRPRSAAPAR